jgi:hypothetical protein
MLKSLHLLFKALEERLRNEINLVLLTTTLFKTLLTSCGAFNIAAQHNSRTAVRISEATLVGSAAMKRISVLGLLFLPGAFICVHYCDVVQLQMLLTYYRHYSIQASSTLPRTAKQSHSTGLFLRNFGSIGWWLFQ